MYNEEEKKLAIGYFEKLINKTYAAQVRDSKIDNQYINMSEIIRYYDKAYGTDFQKTTMSSLKENAYDKFVDELLHERDDDKEKDEGKDIQTEELDKTINKQIDKSKMPSNLLDKSEIMQELKEMAEDEKNITESDVRDFVKAATIKAIYKATLEKYEKNREKIKNHSEITRVRDGEFALEDRLAAENRQYEVYLQKLAKQYQTINPNHKSIQADSKVSGKEKEIRDEHNKEQEIKENKREEEINRIMLLYEAKEEIEEEMAQMSANPSMFNEGRFEDLKDRLFDIDKELAKRPGPATLIENIERDTRQEELDSKALGTDGKIPTASVAQTSKENEERETINDNKIQEETANSIETSKHSIDEVIKKYYECRNAGDLKGAREQYEILMTLNGSKESIQNQIDDVSDKHGNEEYHTKNEKDDNLKEELGLNAVNDDRENAEFDSMDQDVENIAKSNGAYNKTYEQKTEITSNEPKQHTLYGNKKPY